MVKAILNPMKNDFKYACYYMFGYGTPVLIIVLSATIIWFQDRLIVEVFVGDFL